MPLDPVIGQVSVEANKRRGNLVGIITILSFWNGMKCSDRISFVYLYLQSLLSYKRLYHFAYATFQSDSKVEIKTRLPRFARNDRAGKKIKTCLVQKKWVDCKKYFFAWQYFLAILW